MDWLNISKISMTKRVLKKICRKWDTRMLVEVVKRKVRRTKMMKLKMNQSMIEAMMKSADEDDEDEDESIDD